MKSIVYNTTQHVNNSTCGVYFVLYAPYKLCYMFMFVHVDTIRTHQLVTCSYFVLYAPYQWRRKGYLVGGAKLTAVLCARRNIIKLRPLIISEKRLWIACCLLQRGIGYRHDSKDNNCSLLLYKLQMLLYYLPVDKEYFAHKIASTGTVKRGGLSPPSSCEGGATAPP